MSIVNTHLELALLDPYFINSMVKGKAGQFPFLTRPQSSRICKKSFKKNMLWMVFSYVAPCDFCSSCSFCDLVKDGTKNFKKGVGEGNGSNE